jgi:hypothetical protein
VPAWTSRRRDDGCTEHEVLDVRGGLAVERADSFDRPAEA